MKLTSEVRELSEIRAVENILGRVNVCLFVCVLALTVTFPSDTWRVCLIRQKGRAVLISAVDWHLRAAN